jgi:hypothetical protein
MINSLVISVNLLLDYSYLGNKTVPPWEQNVPSLGKNRWCSMDSVFPDYGLMFGKNQNDKSWIMCYFINMCLSSSHYLRAC